MWWGETVSDGFNMHHGLDDGKIQTRHTVISEGKNLGKANETTIEEQVELELISKYKKHLIKLKIPGKLFSDMRFQLDRFNINQKTLFPDMDGLCKNIEWLNSYLEDE